MASLLVLVAAPIAGSAAGATNVPIVCSASGPATLWEGDGTLHWSVSLGGQCETAGDWVLVKAVGSGTSSACAEGQLKNLLLNMTVTYEPVFLPEAVSGITATTHSEAWRAKTTPSAGLTPFLVAEGGKNVGAGNIGFRLAGSCTAKTSLTFRWTRMFTMNVLPILCEGSGTLAMSGSSGFYAWGLSGSAVCERTGHLWDVTFSGDGGRSDNLGICGDPLDRVGHGEGWISGFNVQTDWTNRATGETGRMNVYWNVLDPEPVPFSIRHLDGMISIDPSDGCWEPGGFYPASFRFVVVPATTSI
jgi:hypothetical protein